MGKVLPPAVVTVTSTVSVQAGPNEPCGGVVMLSAVSETMTSPVPGPTEPKSTPVAVDRAFPKMVISVGAAGPSLRLRDRHIGDAM
ncbi:hypothetical protein SHXM_06280 [Streptomyces hygroscopicus]|nr:hypothetical protein SHXM_06280 [Streptomyces hygroscopicus]